MSITGLMAGTEAELVGVEDAPDGGLKLYLNQRSAGRYALVYDEDVKRQVRERWKGIAYRITVPMPPPECIFSDDIPPSFDDG